MGKRRTHRLFDAEKFMKEHSQRLLKVFWLMKFQKKLLLPESLLEKSPKEFLLPKSCHDFLLEEPSKNFLPVESLKKSIV